MRSRRETPVRFQFLDSNEVRLESRSRRNDMLMVADEATFWLDNWKGRYGFVMSATRAQEQLPPKPERR